MTAQDMYEKSDVRLHEITFGEDVFVVKYTHRRDVCEEAAISKEVHIPYGTQNQQLQHWVTEFMEDAHELVEHTEILVRSLNKKEGGLQLV